MIAERNTTIYQPRDFDYGGKSREPVKRNERGSVKKHHAPPSQGGWRDSNDYRTQYFERNHGIGGYGYICSQCWKPMFRKENIQVDHIIPPSRFATKKLKKGKWVKTSMMARFLNHSFNCAAICPDCNRRKSNKMDGQILHGYAMKSVEVLYGGSQFLLSLPFMAVATGMWLTRKFVVAAASYAGGHSNKSKSRNKRR
ncbi:HNH endonuclease [Lysinibacillus xylanilyticus]|uniref:HNH endonuclease n=1 Tax=Lysinibacillus xylanilyticus TaxID=582475 RepID=UPI0036DA375C